MTVWTDFLVKCRNRFTRSAPPQWTDPRISTINDEIDRVKGLLRAARSNFNYVTDPDAIEYYIYLQKAYEVRYDMLVKELKRLAI